MHLKRIIGYLTFACVCVCVHVHVSVYMLILAWIRGCPGVSLVSVGPSNPFKSALLIPLSSHSCRGFMQAHTTSHHRPYGLNFQLVSAKETLTFFKTCLFTSLQRQGRIRRLISVYSLHMKYRDASETLNPLKKINVVDYFNNFVLLQCSEVSPFCLHPEPPIFLFQQ